MTQQKLDACEMTLQYFKGAEYKLATLKGKVENAVSE